MQLQHWRRLASFTEAGVTTEALHTDRQKHSTFLVGLNTRRRGGGAYFAPPNLAW